MTAVAVAIALVAAAQGQSTSPSERKLPVYSQRVNVPADVQGAFLAALERFSKENGFVYRYSPKTPDSPLPFIAEMVRKDALIIASNSLDPTVFRIYYYNGSTPLSKSTLNVLSKRLQAALPPNTSLQDGPAPAPAAELKR